MGNVLTVSQIQRVEKIAIQRIGIPSAVLMENAGRSVAQSVLAAFPSKDLSVKIVCGLGNNGGDGFVAARHLWERKVKVEVMICTAVKNLKNDPRIFYRVIKNLGVPITTLKTINSSILNSIRDCNVIIDALFGIGLNRPLEGIYLQIIQAINDSGKKVWAVDIPSGLDGSSGKVWGNCVAATTTVSFSCMKKGFLIQDGPRYTGRVETVDIGIPRALLQKRRVPCR